MGSEPSLQQYTIDKIVKHNCIFLLFYLLPFDSVPRNWFRKISCSLSDQSTASGNELWHRRHICLARHIYVPMTQHPRGSTFHLTRKPWDHQSPPDRNLCHPLVTQHRPWSHEWMSHKPFYRHLGTRPAQRPVGELLGANHLRRVFQILKVQEKERRKKDMSWTTEQRTCPI